jgi:beta-glucanase (GH16 family)
VNTDARLPVLARSGRPPPAALLLCACAALAGGGCSGSDSGALPGDAQNPEPADGAPPSSGDAAAPRGLPDATGSGPDATGPVSPDATIDTAPSGGDAAPGDGHVHDAAAGHDSGEPPVEAGEGEGDGGGGPEQCTNRAPVDSKWKLAWSDEFDVDGAPNSANWGFEMGFVRNEELQWYQSENATVSNGLLTIAAQKQQVLNPNYQAGSSDWKTSRQYAQYTSSSMTTSGKHAWTYGRFEICAKIDTRQGSWPAFWSLGSGKSWPSSGEVDIMEYYANDVRANVCKPSGSTCDWSGSVSQSLSSLGTDWSSSFHLWAMEWDSTSINLYLDDKLVYPFKVSSAVSSGTNPYMGNSFYILVNQAIGANGGDPSNTTFPIDYVVDYVRVYQD